MSYSETSVAVNDYVKQADYQRLLDNTKFLHTDILRVNGAGDVIIGDTSRADIKSIGRAVQNSSVDILAGTNTAQDARMVLYGDTAGGSYSGVFQQRDDAGNNSFIFTTPNGAAGLFEIGTLAIKSYVTTIQRNVQNSTLYLVGGTTIDPADGTYDADPFILLNGSGSAAANSIVLALGEMTNDILAVTRVESDASQTMFTMQDGVSKFYKPSDNTYYVEVSGEAQHLKLYENSSLRTTIGLTSIRQEGNLNIYSGTGYVRVTSVYDSSQHDWYFRTDGGLLLPLLTADPATPAEGMIWYNTTANKFRGQDNVGTVDLA